MNFRLNFHVNNAIRIIHPCNLLKYMTTEISKMI